MNQVVNQQCDSIVQIQMTQVEHGKTQMQQLLELQQLQQQEQNAFQRIRDLEMRFGIMASQGQQMQKQQKQQQQQQQQQQTSGTKEESEYEVEGRAALRRLRPRRRHDPAGRGDGRRCLHPDEEAWRVILQVRAHCGDRGGKDGPDAAGRLDRPFHRRGDAAVPGLRRGGRALLHGDDHFRVQRGRRCGALRLLGHERRGVSALDLAALLHVHRASGPWSRSSWP